MFTVAEETGKRKVPWEKDFFLEPLGQRGLFTEYLEMCKEYNDSPNSVKNLIYYKDKLLGILWKYRA